MKRLFCVIVMIALVAPVIGVAKSRRLGTYVDALRKKGQDPVEYVVTKFDDVDLILLDDALHPAVQPFRFCERLVRDPGFQDRVRFIFVETIPINKQRHIDDYLSAPDDDPARLFRAFQDDTGGLGFVLQTYFDFLYAVREVNSALPEDRRFEVVAVSNPTYWSEIETPGDVERFRESLLGRDYDMYRIMLARMQNFAEGSKGVFLTNTRHAYTGVRHGNGEFYWNTGTFFRQQHPGRTLSVRIHNISLHISRMKDAPDAPQTMAGTERYDYKWVRVGDGIWDSAFAENGNVPVAFDLRGTAFGREPYIGNHMLDVKRGTQMSDAYDGLIFLAPYEDERFSAKPDEVYTPEFKILLARRYRIMRTDDELAAEFNRAGVASLPELIDVIFTAEPERTLPKVGPIDGWKR